MKVLFITEKYAETPEFGLTNNIVNLIGSYLNSNLGTYEHLYISSDPGDIMSNEQMDMELMNREFDIAVVSIYPPISPSLHIAEKLGTRLVICWWDTVYAGPDQTNILNDRHECFNRFLYQSDMRPCLYKSNILQYSEYCTNIVFDYGFGEIKKNIFGVSVPQDPTIYQKSKNKSIDVSFAGSMDRQGRGELINKLISCGINVYVSGGRGHNKSNLSFNDYGKIMSESKICLNLQLGLRVPQRKGRTFEISACGSFMLANYPDVFIGNEGSFFEEGLHFDSFDENNIVEKVKYWLENEEEREIIAENMYKRHLEKYSPKPWWENILRITS